MQKKISHLLILTILCSNCFSQTYIPYGAYLSANGTHGQPSISYQLVDNALYAAEQRFTVTSTYGQDNVRYLFNGIYDQAATYIPNSQVNVLTVDFMAKGGTSIVYPDGYVYVHFYWTNNTQNVTGRMLSQAGTWVNITGWTNISNNINAVVMRGQVPASFNYATKLELTITATSTTPAMVSQVEYQMSRSGQYEKGVITKFSENTLWKGLYWRNSSNIMSAYVDNTGSAYFIGNVGIGTTTPQAKLSVNGDIFSKKVKVTQTGWPDYVFDSSYYLRPISELEVFIKKNKHLPGVISASKVEAEGLDLGDNQATLLKKIEELTLYLISQHKMIESQQSEIENLRNEIKKISMPTIK